MFSGKLASTMLPNKRLSDEVGIMKLIKKNTILAALLPLVGACSVIDLDEISMMEVHNWEFAQVLHQEYLDLAREEAAEQDWDAATYFGNKAVAAANAANEGAFVPMPQTIAELDLPNYSVNELASARTFLMMALEDGRRTKPQHAARAQVMFDCWMHEQEEGSHSADIAKCHENYDSAYKELSMMMPMVEPMAPAGEEVMAVGPFTVYFEFNSSSLDSVATALIKSLASHKYANDELGYVILSGHTDRSGNRGYNEMLSDKRVMSVSNAFMAQGITARILSTFYGEDRPAMATENGAREPKNRRVKITLSR